MNNKASKRLLAASVASLMLVVAFCGFTYAVDDADAGIGTQTDPYVKKVVVAVNDDDGDDDDDYEGVNDGDVVEFNIVTTQNVNAGAGIYHSGVWYFGDSDRTISTENQDPNGNDSSKVYMKVTTTGSAHLFTVTAKVNAALGSETVVLRYVLTSAIDDGNDDVQDPSFSQTIYYRIDITVVRALPNDLGAGNLLNSMVGYIGVGFVKEVSEWAMYNGSSVLINDGANLKFYASGLPNGLSMNVEGKITGVPKVSGIHNVAVTIYNGTGLSKTFNFQIEVKDHIASLDATVSADGTNVKLVSDDRYVVKQGTSIVVEGVVTGYKDGAMTIDSTTPLTSNDNTETYDAGNYYKDTGKGKAKITLSETGERLIKVTYTFDMDSDAIDSMAPVTIVDYITVVIVDVVEDATTGMGLVAGSP